MLIVVHSSSPPPAGTRMKTFSLLVTLFLLFAGIEALKLQRHRGFRDANLQKRASDLLEDDVVESFFSRPSRRRRTISRFLCGFEILAPTLKICNGCLNKGKWSDLEPLLTDVSLKCCNGRCSESVLKTLCC